VTYTDVSLDEQIIDALIDDVEANAELPGHLTVRYRRPPAITPEMCPVLVGWLLRKIPVPRTTAYPGGGHHSAVWVVGLSWHEAVVEEAVTLVEDVDAARSLSRARAAIEERIQVGSPGGVPGVLGAWEVLPGDSDYVWPDPELQTGLTEGYVVQAVIKVTE
jgi:hypothetical protein